MKRFFALSLCLAAACSTLPGCYGKMALTRKVYQLNGEVKDRYLRSAVTWAFIIVPVYGVSALVDFVLFNTIEFWSGDNPVAAGEKNIHYSKDGENFDILVTRRGNDVRYTIDRNRDGLHLDTLVIDWNTVTQTSHAALNGFGKTVELTAQPDAGGVKVSQRQEPGMETLLYAALGK
ncbi:DUF3332 family protein [Geobacter sp. DSM 9736]|uniref:DUF3332 family protein n=1 Tax=Geobacter sp. DSM 9736 TaxID=1277350 RepID=UPI000B50046E|nr:DUF3332 family protein [Geobacter sp. DSM 9736]SNB46832.1 protein of unknown function [Geobacter sp. DSM 9736]